MEREFEVKREDEVEKFEDCVAGSCRNKEDVEEVVADLFCATGAFRTLGLGWVSTYTNVCCLSWLEPLERRLGDELLSFVLVLPGNANPLEECL